MKNKQGFFLTKLLLCLLLIVTSFNYALKAEEPDDDGNNTVDIEEHVNSYILAEQDIEAPVYNSDISLFANIPESFPDGGVTYLRNTYPESRNQGNYGTCWTFASNGLAEFDLINKGLAKKDEIDLSELQLAYNTYYSVVDPLGGTSGDTSTYDNNAGSNTYLNNGGNFIYSMKRFSQWASAVNESDVPYKNAADTLANGLDSKYAYNYDTAHLENAYIIDIKDTDTVKAMIMEHGGVGTMYVHDEANYAYFEQVKLHTYYSSTPSGGNHAIMIVGWDDNFSKEYFSNSAGTKPSNNGAWLVRNSWGITNAAGNRYVDYFWMSYEESSLIESVYAFDFNTADNYDNNYQLDGGLNTTYLSSSSVSFTAANVYTVDKKDGVDSELLKAIQLSFTRFGGVNYKLQVYTNLTNTNNPISGDLVLTIEDKTTYAGLTTVELEESDYIKLSPGSSYSVLITVDDPSKLDFEGAVSTEKDNTYIWSQTVSTNDKTFYSYDGTNFGKLTYALSLGNLCLKAFTDNLYTLTFDANGGEVTPSSKTLEYGDAYGELPTPTKTGYVFDGWYTATEGGEQVTSSNTISTSTTVYAHWSKAETVTVTFDPNEGTLDAGSSSTKDYTKGDKYGTLPTASREGYVFKGWFTELVGGDEITSSDTVSKTTALFAHWNEIVTITFDPNEGTLDDSTSSPKSYEVGQEYGTLPTASKVGYDFDAWYTDATNGVKIVSTDTASKAFTTLYAHYNPYQYSIVYDGNGANEGSMTPDKATYGKDKTLTTNTFSKTGYSFAGWNTKTDGTGTSYADKATVNSLTSVKNGSVTLYAQWTANNYTIKYDANGGLGNMDDTSATYDQSVTLSNNTFTKTNYTFTGWNTQSDGKGTTYKTGQSVSNLTSTPNGTVTLYAQWARNTHTVTFDANGGSVEPTSSTYEEGKEYGTLPTPTRTGYYFQGWYTAKDDSGTKIDKDKSIVEKDITLYAHWAAEYYPYNIVYETLSGIELGKSTVSNPFDSTVEVSPKKDFEGYTTPNSQTIKWDTIEPKTITFVYTPIEYSIEYELNGGTNVSSNPSKYTIESKDINLSDPTLKGSKFEGWYTDDTYTTEVEKIDSGSTGNKKFYAKWSKETYEYTIKYVSDSGKDLGSTKKAIEYGSTETITAPTKAGYNTPNSQTIDWSSDSREITFTYKPIEYTITYHDVKDADNKANKDSYTIEDNSIDLKDIKLEGYTFNGWFSDEKLENKITSINTKQLKNLDVYASWTVNEYKLIYSIDTTKGGLDNGQASEVTLEYGSKYGTLPNVTAVKGYKFIGWYTENEGGQQVSEDTTMKASDTTIYARFEEVTYKAYKLTFNGNGGTVSQDFKEVKETYEVGQLPNAIKEGYTFAGWYTSADGGSKVTDTYVMPSSDLTIYAHWNVNSYKLTFVSDGETLEEKNVNYNDSLGELPTPEDKLGYEFIGWFDGDTEYTAESKMPASELTLTAHFKALEKPSITFNGNGGTSSVDGGQVNFDGKLEGTLPTATRKGYTFAGWYTEANGGTKLENDSNFKDISEIYAHWTINSYTISFDSNGGNEVASISVEYDSTYFDSLPTPTKDKYKFLGWYTSDDQAVNENSKISDSDITLYAKWEYIPQAYTLTLVYNDGTSKIDERSIIENNEYGELPTPTRDGYVFDGWYDSLSDGAKVTAKTTMDSKDVTIYAHWIRINRTIKLNANLEGVDDLSIYVDDDNHFIGNLPTLVKNGKYNFDGWYTKALDGEKVSDTSDLTGINELYAHWVKDPGKVEVIDPKTDDTTKELEPKLEVEDSTVKNLLTKDENDLVQKGDDADVYLTVLEGKDDKEIDLAKAKLGTYEFGQALDITLNIKVGNNTPRKISDSKDEVSITINIPEDLINKDSSKTRTYYVIRVHDGKAEYLNNVTYNKANNTLTFKSRYFSTYVIAYRDTDNPKPSANTGHHVSCEEYMNSNNWTWSEKSQKCVFKVSNTGTK